VQWVCQDKTDIEAPVVDCNIDGAEPNEMYNDAARIWHQGVEPLATLEPEVVSALQEYNTRVGRCGEDDGESAK